MNEHVLSVQGVTIRLTSDNLALDPWAHYPLISGHSQKSQAVDLTAHLHGIPTREAIPSGVWSPSSSSMGMRRIDTGHHTYHLSLFQDDHDLILDFQDIGLWRIDGTTGHADGYLLQDQQYLLAKDPKCSFFILPLIELLKWHGLYLIHAVVLEKHGMGLVLTGPPGRGKSTAGLALTRAGYHFLSDDMPFLREVNDEVEIVPWSQRINICHQTTSLIPELHHLTMNPEDERDGVKITLKNWRPDQTITSCRPRVMLFPQVVTEPISTLEPMTKVQAFQEFLHQSALLHHRTMVQNELQAFSRLIESVDCYRLYSGQDVLDLPTLIDPLMAECVG